MWIEVHVPENAAPGDYDGRLSVSADGVSLDLPVTLRVWDFEVSQERHLSVVNWWQFPGPGFEGHGPDDWDLLRRFAGFLVEHRQTDLSVGIRRIQESGDAQKGYTHDTRSLERYAEVAFEAGIRQIHLHSVGRRTAGILDPAARVVPDDSNLRRLAAWEQVIRRRNWQRRFVTSIVDEPFVYYEDSYQATVNRVHAVAPSVRCLEAVEAEYLGKLDVYVPKLSHLAMWYPRFDQVRREGAELWFYVCCHPLGRYPNRFLDQSLLKARVLFWISYLYNLDGYLHWGLNYYAGDPYTQEGISKDLPLGDRAVVYPGRDRLLGSLRFSAQRDGVQDFEYLRLLEARLREIKQQAGEDGFWLDPRQRPLELCRRVIWSFHDYTRDARLMLETRQAIAREIEALQVEPRLVVQTSPPEGTVVPAGPRAVNVRGLAPPGAKVTINGEAVVEHAPERLFLSGRVPGGQATHHHGRRRAPWPENKRHPDFQAERLIRRARLVRVLLVVLQAWPRAPAYFAAQQEASLLPQAWQVWTTTSLAIFPCPWVTRLVSQAEQRWIFTVFSSFWLAPLNAFSATVTSVSLHFGQDIVPLRSASPGCNAAGALTGLSCMSFSAPFCWAWAEAGAETRPTPASARLATTIHRQMFFTVFIL